MKKTALALTILSCTPSIRAIDTLSRAYGAPKKVSFFSRATSDQEDIGVLLRALKEFLYEQGLYDAAEIVIALERGMEEPHIHTAP